MKNIALVIGLLSTVCLLSFYACKTMDKKMKNKIKQIETFTYAFGDASVPPPYHRSYEIHVNKDSVKLTVDSYGDILASKEYELPEDAFKIIEKLLLKHKIETRTSKVENDGCTGGNSRYISFTCNNGEGGFSGNVYYCGGKKYGSMQGEVRTFASEFTKVFTPDLSEVIRSTE